MERKMSNFEMTRRTFFAGASKVAVAGALIAAIPSEVFAANKFDCVRAEMLRISKMSDDNIDIHAAYDKLINYMMDEFITPFKDVRKNDEAMTMITRVFKGDDEKSWASSENGWSDPDKQTYRQELYSNTTYGTPETCAAFVVATLRFSLFELDLKVDPTQLESFNKIHIELGAFVARSIMDDKDSAYIESQPQYQFNGGV